MRLPIARSATPQHAPDRHECAISKPTPDTPRLVVIVIVLSLASVQAVLGQGCVLGSGVRVCPC